MILHLAAAVIFSLVFATVSGQRLYSDDVCQLNNGHPGVCKAIDLCQPILNAIQNGFNPVVCGYENRVTIVCCPGRPPRTTTRRTPPPTRPPPVTKPGTYRGKTWDKCLEYAAIVNMTTIQPVFTIGELVTTDSVCAISSQQLIIGGERCEPKEFPHMTALGFGPESDISWKCGGSLISERYVLTAAHCLFARGIGKVSWARLGDLNLQETTDDSMPQTHAVEKIIPHPEYKSTSNYHDIALLKLANDVTFNHYVRPVCLNTFRSTPKGQVATATGWGVTSWTNDHGSDDLMKVDLRYDTPQKCNQTFASLIRGSKKLLRGFTDDTMICAGDPEGKKDTCVGDSGGPLQIQLQQPYYCMYSIVGLTSFGSTACGESNSPAVYTRVSHYVPWIQGIVWPN